MRVHPSPQSPGGVRLACLLTAGLTLIQTFPGAPAEASGSPRGAFSPLPEAVVPRLERGAVALDFEPQVLDALIAEVMASHEARAHLKQIDLRHEPDPNMPLVSVAHGPMVQVLTNLIGNAVSYAPAGAVVTVGTRVDAARGARFAAVRVHNSQPAIPPEDLPHLFERFFRGRTGLESGEAGTGLGLAICKEIVERHHGWIDVESDPAKGTAFSVWLPLDNETPR